MTPQTPGQRVADGIERMITKAIADAQRLNTDPMVTAEDWKAVAGDFKAVMGDVRSAIDGGSLGHLYGVPIVVSPHVPEGQMIVGDLAAANDALRDGRVPSVVMVKNLSVLKPRRRRWWRRLLWWRKAAGPAR